MRRRSVNVSNRRAKTMDGKTKQTVAAASVVAFPGARPRPVANQHAATDHQLLLDTVINNMSLGVLMFDAEARLVFCNQRYVEMYGLSPAVVTPGCALRELLEHRAAVGAFVGSPEEYIVDLLEDIAAGRPPTPPSSRRTAGFSPSCAIQSRAGDGSPPTRTSPIASGPRSASCTWPATTRSPTCPTA
jgi:PAS domain-containing protein